MSCGRNVLVQRDFDLQCFSIIKHFDGQVTKTEEKNEYN